jgi:hypothetical protein
MMLLNKAVNQLRLGCRRLVHSLFFLYMLSCCSLFRIKDGKVVRVPDDAPPLNRHQHEWWPPGWEPLEKEDGQQAADLPERAAASAAQPGSVTATAAGSGAGEGQQLAGAEWTVTAGSVGGQQQQQQQQAVYGADGRRLARSERGVFELLGLRYREPYQRDCP